MIAGKGTLAAGLYAARHPVIAAIALGAILTACILLLTQLTFDRQILRTFASESKISRDYRAFLEQRGPDAPEIVILATSEHPFSADDYTQMRDIALEMELADHVTGVISPFSLRYPLNHEVFPGDPVFPVEIETEDVNARLDLYSQTVSRERQLLDAEQETALIIASIEPDVSDATIRAVHKVFKTIIAEMNSSPVSYTVTGEAAIAIEIVDELRADLLNLNLAGGFLVLLFAIYYFRNATMVAIAAIPPALGVAATLALFPILGYPVTVISNVVPVLALVLGLADNFHLVMRYLETDATKPNEERVVAAIRDVGPACAMTALTTAIAFSAVVITDNQQLREFAILGALSTIVSYLMVISGFAVLTRLLKPADARTAGTLERIPVPGFVPWTVFNRQKTVVFAGIVIGIAAMAGYALTKPWFSIYENLPDASSVRLASERAEEKFGGFYKVWAEYDTTGANALSTPAGWDRLRAVTETLEGASDGRSVISLATVSRWLGHPERPPDQKEYDELPAQIRAELGPASSPVAHVIVLTGDPMRSEKSEATHDAIEQAAQESGAQRVTGLPVLMRHEPLAMLRELSLSLLGACVIAVGVVAFAFRRPHLAVTLLLPNVMPLALTASALHVFEGGLINPAAALALTIAFGVAIDDSIHFINRYELERRLGRVVDRALEISLKETGRVMIATTLLISCGMLVTFTSGFPTVRQFGTMMIMTFASALVADLLLLPALLRYKWLR